MQHHHIVEALHRHFLIGIVRAPGTADDLVRIVAALAEGGIRAVEIALNSPSALEGIAAARTVCADCGVLLGAGTVLDPAACERAIGAGAEYIVSPVASAELIQTARRYGKASLPGAYSPTEVLQAWTWGADIVKLFPSAHAGLPYIKALRGPLPQIPLAPTGGVTADNIADYIVAGVAAVGVGNGLVTHALAETRDYKTIAENARRFTDALHIARDQ